MIAHHSHQNKAQHPHQSRVQMQPIKQQPRIPTSNHSNQLHHIAPPQQHDGNQNHYQQVVFHHQPQAGLEAPLDQHHHHHASHHHNHHHHQQQHRNQINSEQQQSNGASNNYYNSEQQYHMQQQQQPIDVPNAPQLHQQQQQLHAGGQMYDQEGMRSSMVQPGHLQNRFAPANTGPSHHQQPPQNHLTHGLSLSQQQTTSSTGPTQQSYISPVAQTNLVAAQQQPPPPQIHASFQPGQTAPEMTPGQQPLPQFPRANHLPPHQQNHHHPNQQHRVLGPGPAMAPQQQQQHYNAQHIPVRSNNTVAVGAVGAGPESRLVGAEHHHLAHQPQQQQQQQQQRAHIPYGRPATSHSQALGSEIHPMGSNNGGNLLQQQLNARRPTGGPSQPVHVQGHQPLAANLKHSPRPAAALQPHGPNEVYQQRVAPLQPGHLSACKQPVRAQQAIRQQVINQAPLQLDNGNLHLNHHHHHQHPQQQQQQQHLLCNPNPNPTPPLTPNTMMVGPQQHQARPPHQQHPDEWPPQSHPLHHNHHQHHRQQQHNLEPISEQPQLPIQSTSGVAFTNGPGMAAQPQGPPPMQHQLKHLQHQMRPAQPAMMPNLISDTAQQQQQPMEPKGLVAPQYHSHQSQSQQVIRSQPQAPGLQPGLNHINADHLDNQHHNQFPLSNQTNLNQTLPNSRLTLPLRDGCLLGPFALEHGVQYQRKVFHIKSQLMDLLSKFQQQQHSAAVVQELQFRAYLINQTNGAASARSLGSGDSLLAPQSPQQSPAINSKACQWPDFFQVSINQQLVHLDRSPKVHQALDVFKFCHLGENLIEFKTDACHCSYEFVLELVDRPTIKAFMDSCFKSRLLPQSNCLLRLEKNFGSSGFVQNKLSPEASQLLQVAGIQNDYMNEFGQPTKVRISLRCPLSARRMRAPARGPHCRHLQCFDLENFLQTNCHHKLWSCPICSLEIPFNMLELDQFQLGILQTASQQQLDTDEILLDRKGQWQAYYRDQTERLGGDFQHEPLVSQTMSVAKTNGTFHPQASQRPTQSSSSPMRPLSGNGARLQHANTNWSHQEAVPHQETVPHRVSPVRRPPSAIGGDGGQATPPRVVSKRPAYSQRSPATGNQSPQQQQQQQQLNHNPSHQLVVPNQATVAGEELSPLAAMERTIIQHEQQMCPPPFDPNSLTASPMRSSTTAPAGAPTSQPATASSTQPPAQGVVQSVSSPGRPPAVGQVPASPHQTSLVCQSPQLMGATTNLSMPATPIIHHIGPETPATPGSASGNNQPPIQQPPQTQSNAVAPSSFAQLVTGSCSMNQGVDHQPLSNGSASAGSITSSSTVMTPSGQSLGSVGMGGDSRCNTAPLQAGGSLDLGDLSSLVNSHNDGPQGGSSNVAGHSQGSSHRHHQQQQQHISGNRHQGQESLMMNAFDDKNSDILMSKLMMDSDSDSMLHRQSELTMALEEAQWKQQLDRGKSEHLANFLNDPLMIGQGNRKHHNHHHHHHHYNNNNNDNHQQGDGANKMLSGGLNPSDDESNDNSPHDSSPSGDLAESSSHSHHQHQACGGSGSSLDQSLDPFAANYLDSSSVDDGAGLPPDDSILDLFER